MKEATLTNPLCGAETRSGKPFEKFPFASKRRRRLHCGLSTAPKQRQAVLLEPPLNTSTIAI